MRKVETEVLQTLRGELDFLLEQIGELDEKLAMNIEHIDKYEHLVTGAYHLSCIYSCFEDVFSKVARVFENRIENPASWHKELLERMRISVSGVRPSVISKEIFPILDEMRGFRHVFKSSYAFSLDREKVLMVAKRWQENKNIILKETNEFMNKIGCK